MVGMGTICSAVSQIQKGGHIFPKITEECTYGKFCFHVILSSNI